MNPHIIAIYHADCPDGTTAAACLLARYPEAHLFPLTHAYTPGELKVITDRVTPETIAYTLDCVIGARELAEHAKELHIIDHHESAEGETRAFAAEKPNVTFTFDNEHSGASLAWSYFNPGIAVPEFVSLVEMDDLYKFAEGNRDRSRMIVVHLMTMLNHPELVAQLLTSPIEPLLASGKIMLDYQESLVRNFVEQAVPLSVRVGEHVVPAYNVMSFGNFFDSDIKSAALKKHATPICAFTIAGDTVRLSFRSEEGMAPTALDLASILGGGGHKHASGARMNREGFFKMVLD